MVCQTCGHVQKEPAGNYKDIRGPVRIQCPCGHVYDIEVEFRKFYRRETRLDGVYAPVSDPRGWCKIIVKNLSLGGCGFEMAAGNVLHPGDEISIEFKLNDVKQTLVKRKAVVLSVRGRFVGCRFKELPGTFDPDLGFYLRKA